MRVAIAQFPGSNCEYDVQHVVTDVLGAPSEVIWHRETSLAGFDAVVLPGGFAHGDYLRPGGIARFSPIMKPVEEFAKTGKPVVGICNGFQVLVEAGLLPGALMQNACLHYVCRFLHLRTETSNSAFSSKIPKGTVLRMPIGHGDGNYYCDPEALAELQRNDQIVFRYCEADGRITSEANPNGSLQNIAGICNRGRNVVGMMPHPDRASEVELGSMEGRALFESLLTPAFAQALA